MLRWFKSNHQALTAIGAMVVGLAALFIAWDQARVMRAQQHGAVVPVLQVDGFIQSTETQRDLGLRLVNNGVGPAMIRTVTLMRDYAPTDGFDPLVAHFPDDFDRSWSSVNGRALAPGGEVMPVVFNWDRDALSEQELVALLNEWNRWGVEVCYCSVFERCWISSSSQTLREPVGSCPDSAIDQFERIGREDRPDLPFATPAEEPTP